MLARAYSGVVAVVLLTTLGACGSPVDASSAPAVPTHDPSTSSAGPTPTGVDPPVPPRAEMRPPADHTSTPSPEPSADRTSTPPPVPPPVPPEVSDAAMSGAEEYVAAVTDLLAAPQSAPSATPSADAVINGAALDAILNQAAEYADQGWHVEGSPVVLGVEVLEWSEGPEGRRQPMVVGACLDNSAVRVVDDAGNVVSDGADQPPTLNIYTLEQGDTGWRVVDQTFPDQPDC